MGAGTGGSQAAVHFSVLVVFLLLKFGHQAEFPTAAAFGEIQRHILWWERRDTENQTQLTRPRNGSGARRGGRGPRRRRFVPGLLILVFFLDFSLVFIVRF